jgi:hypothetical protein
LKAEAQMDLAEVLPKWELPSELEETLRQRHGDARVDAALNYLSQEDARIMPDGIGKARCELPMSAGSSMVRPVLLITHDEGKIIDIDIQEEMLLD